MKNNNITSKILDKYILLIYLLCSNVFVGFNYLNLNLNLNRISNILIVLNALFSIMYIVKEGSFEKVFKKNFFLVFFIASCFVISLLGSDEKVITIYQNFYLCCTLLFALFMTEFYSVDILIDKIFTNHIIILLMSILFIIFFSNDAIESNVFNLGSFNSYMISSLRGPFNHKNEFAAILAVTCLLSIAVFYRSKNLSKKIMCILILVTSAYLLLKTNSSTAVLCIIAPIICFLLFKNLKIKINYLTIFILGNICLIIFQAVYINNIYSFETVNQLMKTYLNRDISFTGRDAIWFYVLEVIKQRPILGYGYFTFWGYNELENFIYSNTFYGFSSAHNGILEMLLQLGMVGGVFFIALLIDTGRKIKKVHSNVSLLVFPFLFMVYIVIYMISERVLFPKYYQTILFFLCISIINNIYYTNRNTK
jgi:exopolysaccharide production protein ExoQ